MKVKIKGRIYDSEKEPVMVILSDEDKRNISAMPPDSSKYASFPDSDEWTMNNCEKIKEWMADVNHSTHP